MSAKIHSVEAREIMAERGTLGLEVIVTTDTGAVGRSTPTTGVSIGKYEAAFVVDGGGRFGGRGLRKAVQNIGRSRRADRDGRPSPARNRRTAHPARRHADQGEAGRKCHRRHFARGVQGRRKRRRAAAVPVHRRRQRAHLSDAHFRHLPVRPLPRSGQDALAQTELRDHSVRCDRVRERRRDGLEVQRAFTRWSSNAMGSTSTGSSRWRRATAPSGCPASIKDDREILDALTEAIVATGNEATTGIYYDAAAGCYYEEDIDRYVGIYSEGEKTRDQMIALYKEFVANYPLGLARRSAARGRHGGPRHRHAGDGHRDRGR